MIYLFGDTFNKKVVLKLAGDGLKYTRAQYQGKLVDNPKHERPPMVPKQECTSTCDQFCHGKNVAISTDKRGYCHV